MSGVIDKDGTQWEHCDGCYDWTKFKDLGYLKPTKHYIHGLSICANCADILLRCRLVKFNRIQPALTWKRQIVVLK